eukprot:g6758.t1
MEKKKKKRALANVLRVDFKGLSERHPNILKKEYFKVKGDGSVTLRFEDPKVSIALTRATLKDAFQIECEIPEDRLCPPVPNRVNYVKWLNELLSLKLVEDSEMKGKQFTGLDIGVGASCIYPLLGHRIFGWNYVGTEIDRKSFEWARNNVRRNGFEKHIELRLVKEDDDLVSERDADKVDFCMCNPPFFEDKDEVSPHPSRACSGSSNEMITKGGEVKFVIRIIENSLKLGTKLRWYTSMLGRKSSIVTLVRHLRSTNRVKEIVSSEFLQGQTRRWGLAWSFHEVEDSDTKKMERLRCYVAESSKRKRKLKERSSRSCLEFEFEFGDVVNRATAKARVQECFKECEMSSDRNKKGSWAKGLGFKWSDDVWSGSGVLPECGLKFCVMLSKISCMIRSESDVTSKKARQRGGSAWTFRVLCDRMKGDVIRQNRKWKRRRKE